PCLGPLHGDVSTIDEGFGVQLAGGALGVDDVVHQWLGEGGVVTLVVPATAVAHQVDDDFLVERLTVGKGQFRNPNHGLGVVPVDVEDRCLDHARHVGGVDAGATVRRRGGETDLVVQDDVH